jgi:hypothetical protein
MNKHNNVQSILIAHSNSNNTHQTVSPCQRIKSRNSPTLVSKMDPAPISMTYGLALLRSLVMWCATATLCFPTRRCSTWASCFLSPWLVRLVFWESINTLSATNLTSANNPLLKLIAISRASERTTALETTTHSRTVSLTKRRSRTRRRRGGINGRCIARSTLR